MTAKKSQRPTEGELKVLQVLWERGPSTVREVTEVLSQQRRTGYTTVLKLLQIMTEKGLVRRRKKGISHIYRASQPHEQTQRHLLNDLMERAFRGSTSSLVQQALSLKEASKEELAEIRELLDELEGKKK